MRQNIPDGTVNKQLTTIKNESILDEVTICCICWKRITSAMQERR